METDDNTTNIIEIEGTDFIFNLILVLILVSYTAFYLSFTDVVDIEPTLIWIKNIIEAVKI